MKKMYNVPDLEKGMIMGLDTTAWTVGTPGAPS